MAHELRRGSAITIAASSIVRTRSEVLLDTVLIVNAFIVHVLIVFLNHAINLLRPAVRCPNGSSWRGLRGQRYGNA